MMIHEITKKVGKNKQARRVGRGHGSGWGKTSSRGHKGAGQRAGSGSQQHPLYEGGQIQYFRRIPKRGFNNSVFRKYFNIVNVSSLEERFESGADVSGDALVKVGLVHDLKLPIKILGEGELTKKLNVTAAKFSSGAVKKIEAAGGTCTVA